MLPAGRTDGVTFAGRLFRRHVAWGVQSCRGCGQARVVVKQFGQAKVSDVRYAEFVDEDVRGLQIAMQNAV